MNSCLIAGSFDPITNGHRELILRASKLFDKVYVVIFRNSEKNCLFSPEERKRMLDASCADIQGVVTDISDGLVVDYAAEKEIPVIVKGIRDELDFTYESRMERINHELNPNVETVFLLSDPALSFISSSFVRELLNRGKDIGAYIPTGAYEIVKKIEKGI